MQITLVLHNIRSTYNVGAILRTAEGLGVERVVYSGYTPRHDDPGLLPHLREKLNHQIAKSALGAEKLVPQEIVDDLPNYLCTQRAAGWTLVGLENNLSASELPRRIILGRPYSADEPKSSLPDEQKTASITVHSADLGKKVVLVLGEEVDGIPAEIRPLVDFFLEIPMSGQKESFNVSVATGIAIWGLQNCY